MQLFPVFVVLLVLVSLQAGALGQTWTVQNYYSDTTCQTLIGVQYTLGSGSCTSIDCTVSGSQSFQQFCSIGSVPAMPPSWLVLTSFSATGCQGGTVTNVVATATSVCLPIAGGSGSWLLSCSGGNTLTRTVFTSPGCAGSSSPPSVTSGCMDTGISSSRSAQCPPTCSPSVRAALSSATIPTGTVGFITTATVTFCTSATSQVFLSGDSSLSGGITVDDMVVYQLDANGVTGLAFSAACSTSGFLAIASGNVATGGISSHGPPILLGTLGAGSHTLKIGTYNCGGAVTSHPINIVGCSLTACAPAPPPNPPTTSPSSSATVWSGTYVVNAGCSQSQCCCAVGSITMTQVGSQVSGTVNVAGQCGGATSAPFSATLSSPTATSGMWGQNNLVKNGATVTATNVANSACSATLTCTSGDCLPGGGGASSSVCFHESTAITYGGQHWTLDQLLNHAANPTKQCTVPHVVKAVGVIISISCSTDEHTLLRLTKDHLVFTRSGLKQAVALVPGQDVLFADLKQTKECRVIAVTPEASEQRYFGLNCLESVVLANGIKASTFGHYHAIPAAWMSWVGAALGVDRASHWGDSIVDLLAKMKLL